MKPNCYQLILIMLLLTAGCNTAGNNDVQHIKSNMVKDTVFASWTDSLKYVAKNATAKEQLKALNELMYFYFYQNLALTKQYANEGLVIAIKEKNKSAEANIINFYGRLYYNQNKVDSAIIYYRKALEMYEAIDGKRGIAKTKMDLADVLGAILQFDEALEYLHDALDYFTSIDDRLVMAAVLGNTARIYYDMKDWSKYNEYIDKAMSLYEQLDNKEGIAIMLIGKCSGKSNQGQYEEAIELGEQAVSLLREINSIMYLGAALGRVTEVYIKMEQYEKAKLCVEESIDIARKTGNNFYLQEALRTRAQLYMQQKKYDLAIKFTDEAMTIMDATLKSDLLHAYSIYTVSSIMLGKKDDAYKNFMKVLAVKDELHNEQWAEKLNEMEVKYETEKKELEIEHQQLIIGRQNTQRLVLLVGIALCIVILSLLWYMLQLRNRRNRALAEMNATKDKFFSIISHDLKNPALAQRDALQLLVKNAHTWDTDTLTEYYHELLKSAEGEVELIYHLLNWAQLQTGRMTYTPTTFNLLARLRPDLSLIRKMAENKKITFNVQIPDDLVVTADSDMIATVIRNLLTNAVKFTPGGGEISICRDAINRVSTTRNFTTIITITDTGIGMNTEQLRNLFSIDRQRLFKGLAHEQNTGLGLIVCKELLEKHGSALHVESEEGKGSKFWFELP